MLARADRIIEESTCLGILPIPSDSQNALQSAMNPKTEISIVKSSTLK